MVVENQDVYALTYTNEKIMVYLAMDTSDTKMGSRAPVGHLGKVDKEEAWQPTPVFLSGESHGQRSLVGYSPWGCKGSDMTEAI